MLEFLYGSQNGADRISTTYGCSGTEVPPVGPLKPYHGRYHGVSHDTKFRRRLTINRGCEVRHVAPWKVAKLVVLLLY